MTINAAEVLGPEEGIVHFGAVRLRVNGAGILRPSLLSLDYVRSQTLATITMQETTDREPRVLANFKQQRAFLKLETTAINEVFRINRIVIFVKPIWTDYPNGV